MAKRYIHLALLSYFGPLHKNKTMEKAEIFSAAESIQYAEGSVVSKMIIKKPTGNITLFAFDKNEGLSEHSSPHEALVQVIDGSAEITINGEAHDVKAGQCIILPDNVPHALKANERFKMILTMIKQP